MDNTIAGRNDLKVLESFLTPLEESKTFLVAVELKSFVLLFSSSSTGNIDLDGVIDN